MRNIERLGLASRVDYFPIRENKELRGIGFKPMTKEIASEILKDAPVQFLSSFARQ